MSGGTAPTSTSLATRPLPWQATYRVASPPPVECPMWTASRRPRCSTTVATVGGIVVHVVAVADLARPAVAAPVMGDDAVALPEEEEHLGVPVVAAQRPAVVEHDRLRVPRTPVLVVDLRPVFGGDWRHSASPDDSLSSCLRMMFTFLRNASVAWVVLDHARGPRRRSVQSTRFWSSWRISFFEVSSRRFPWASKRSAAFPVITSGWLMAYTFRNTNTCRRWYWARAVPVPPIDAPMIAAGLPLHALSPCGRDAQSMAFFRTPGIE